MSRQHRFPIQFPSALAPTSRRARAAALAVLTAGAAAAAAACEGAAITTAPGALAGWKGDAEAVRVTVDWDAAQYRTTRHGFGLAVYSGMVPEVAADAQYGANLAYMDAGLLRYHYARLVRDVSRDPRGWANEKERRWDRARIAAAMDGAAGWGQAHGYRPDMVMTIPSWPDWMKTYSVTIPQPNGTTRSVQLLDPSEWDNFAAFCADLVRALNVEQRRGVRYFEVTNERDNLYYVEFAERANLPYDKLPELVEIYNRAARAMKAVDPTIQVGGPAFARGDLTAQVRRFVQGTRDDLDFVSIHFYASGNKAESDAQVYGRTGSLLRHTRDVVRILEEEVPGRAVPIHVNEHNISWTFTNDDPRMRNHKGAVFDALAITAALDGGATATNAWNERDGVYGKMDTRNALRPSAHVYHLFNRHLVGARVATATSDSAVVPYAVTHPEAGSRALVLINRSDAEQRVSLESARGNYGLSGWYALRAHTVSAAGLAERAVTWGQVESGRLTLPAHSVTVLAPESRRPE